MKILFMGTPDFSVHTLKSLVNAGHNITSVITQPDKPKGRGHKMTHPPVYDCAAEMNLTIHQPETLKNNAIADILDAEKPELIVVVAYGKILPEYVLNFPQYGCVNVHASLLPKYRGAAPIQRVIIDGETETGITTMYMAKGLDTGDMIEKAVVKITEDDTFESLHDKLAETGSKLIVSTVSAIENGTAVREVQDDSLSCYAEMITKETARIDWNKSAHDIYNLVRGLYPVPKAFTFMDGTQFKITSGSYHDYKGSEIPGIVVEVTDDYIRVACGNGSAFDITGIQPEGKRAMSVNDYLKGNEVKTGRIFN